MKQNSTNHNLINRLQTAVFVVDASLNICEVNLAAEELAEIGKRQLLCANFTQIFAENECPVQVLQISLTTGKSYFQKDIAATLLSGRNTIFNLSIIRFVHLENNYLLIEISQSRSSAIVTVKEKELGQHRQTRHLLKDLAHEIRNPLGGLRGAAQLLATEITADQKPFTDIIIREADRLGALVERVLSRGKPESKTVFNIHEVIEEVLTLIAFDLPDGIKINRDYDPSLPGFNGYKNNIHQALLNLIRNAVQAIAESDNKQQHVIDIITRAEHSVLIGDTYIAMTLRIDICDDGPGIVPAMIENLFMPMSTSRKQGTGLGLAIARDAVEQHGGSLQWLKNENKTVFCIHLPQHKTV